MKQEFLFKPTGPYRIEPAWDLPRAGAYLELRIRRSTLVAMLVSLLVHAVLLFIFTQRLQHVGHPRTPDIQAPLVVRLTPLPPAQAALRPPTKTPQLHTRPAPKPRPRITPPHAPPKAAIATAKPAPSSPAAPVPPIPAPAPDSAAPPADMMAYVNAARARRRAVELAAKRENAEAGAGESAPSEDEIRLANIKRNLQPQGTNGVFQILSIGMHTAEYSFRGWLTEYSYSRRQVIEVETAPHEDIEHAIVRSMIRLIRKYYKGDFNWESQRLHRVVVLSARPEDNAGLEDFLIREFFGDGTGPPGQ